jgi:uncharacterized protein (TIGR03083 family)
VTPLEPIRVEHLFGELHQELLRLLRGLPADAWDLPTVARRWRVRDVTAHLLDVQIRRLTFGRDGLASPPSRTPINSYSALVNYLNQLNAEWVQAARRISPRLLVEMLEIVGPQVAAYFAGLDPLAPSRVAVAWAGDEVSPNWFDTAREYTEHWHHQQQIRDAVGAPPLTARKWLAPMLEASVRALPHAYRQVEAVPGATVVIEITGEAGGTWSLRREGAGWQLLAGEAPGHSTRVTTDADSAWRLFFHQFTREEAARRVTITGDHLLGEAVFQTRAVMV